MVLESFFVGGELGHALREVDVEGGEAVGFEVDFLVVRDLPDCAGKRGRVSQVVGGSVEDFEIDKVDFQKGIAASMNSASSLTGEIPRDIEASSKSQVFFILRNGGRIELCSRFDFSCSDEIIEYNRTANQLTLHQRIRQVYWP